MVEQLITFETAKLAKEKGFYELSSDNENIRLFTDEVYTEKRNLISLSDFISSKHGSIVGKTLINAPTQSLLQKWLREKHSIVVYVLPHAPQKKIDTRVPLYSGCLWYKNEYQSEMKSYKTYEEALENALFEALKLI